MHRLILIFFIFGIFMAKGSEIRCFTPERGFEPFCIENTDTICNSSFTDKWRTAPFDADTSGFLWRTLAIPVQNRFGKKYSYTGADGKQKKIEHPAWGVALISEEKDTLLFRLHTDTKKNSLEDIFVNNTEAMTLQVLLYSRQNGAVLLDSASVKRSQADIYDGANWLTVSRTGDDISFSIGNRKQTRVATVHLSGFKVREAGYYLAPAALLQLQYVSLRCDGQYRVLPYTANEFEATREAPLCGVWQLTNQSVDTGWFMPGGNYLVGIRLASDGGYEMLYLDGATINAEAWQPGMMKGVLQATSTPGVFNVVWYDAEHHPVSRMVQAQAQTDENMLRYTTLVINFPLQNSTLTFIKTK